MSSPRYLLDASAIYPLLLSLRENIVGYVELFAVLDLTIYEVGNVVWKEYRRGRIKDYRPVAVLFRELFNNMTILETGTLIEDILELAVKENLTYYDASYLYTARRHGLKLVTEDKDLLRYPVSINVAKLVEELGITETRKQGH